eukprot:3850634-Rhodomonas_salina.1
MPLIVVSSCESVSNSPLNTFSSVPLPRRHHRHTTLEAEQHAYIYCQTGSLPADHRADGFCARNDVGQKVPPPKKNGGNTTTQEHKTNIINYSNEQRSAKRTQKQLAGAWRGLFCAAGLHSAGRHKLQQLHPTPTHTHTHMLKSILLERPDNAVHNQYNA